MKYQLTDIEARIIGCLLEKQITTPDLYPMSLNAVVTACNQKSNRHPVMNLDKITVQNTLDALVKSHYLHAINNAGSRITKYEQRFCNSVFGSVQLSVGEVAVITLLLLRGAQTAGELRSRSVRLHPFRDIQKVEAALEKLATRESGAFVVQLPPEPGKRECRYQHLFTVS